MQTGLERFLAKPPDAALGVRLGLVTNPCGVNAELRSAIDLMHAHPQLNLRALYGPEHGIRGEVQAGDHVASETDPRTGLLIHSLYGVSRMPGSDMLRGIDTLVVDFQDIGARFTTYVSTIDNLIVACNSHNKQLIVLDRPNPLGGEVVASNVLEPQFRSFVGTHDIAMIHGMTLGELAMMIASDRGLPRPTIVPMHGWSRSMTWDRTGLPWVFPSPNLPTLDTHYAYAATCFFEGTNWSEGRGTTRPFELVGAPWVDPVAFASAIEDRQLPGISVRPLYVTPYASKHDRARCGGIQIYATPPSLPHAPEIGLHLLDIAFRLFPETSWIAPTHPGDRYFVDLLAGSRRLRDTIDARDELTVLIADWQRQSQGFRNRRAPFLLYDSDDVLPSQGRMHD